MVHMYTLKMGIEVHRKRSNEYTRRKYNKDANINTAVSWLRQHKPRIIKYVYQWSRKLGAVANKGQDVSS